MDESKLPPADKGADGIGEVDATRNRLLRVLRAVGLVEELRSDRFSVETERLDFAATAIDPLVGPLAGLLQQTGPGAATPAAAWPRTCWVVGVDRASMLRVEPLDSPVQRDGEGGASPGRDGSGPGEGPIGGPASGHSPRFGGDPWPWQQRRAGPQRLVLSEVADGEAAAGGLLAAADFERRLGVELARCQRYGRVLSFGLLDPDGLSALRSRSPAAADRVLRQLARFTVAHLRRTDVSGRCGAGGIGVLLTETTAARGLGVFERLRVGFVQGQLRVQPRVPAVSLSIGVVECRGERDAAGVLAVAQTAVEAARAAGEDCVRLAPAA